MFPATQLNGKCTHDYLHTPLLITILKNDMKIGPLKAVLCMNLIEFTLTKLRKPWGSPGKTSNPTGIPSDFSLFAIIMQSSRQGSISTD